MQEHAPSASSATAGRIVPEGWHLFDPRGSAGPEEAAAVVAALEQFMRATARVPVAPDAAAAPVPGSAWQQAALAEGVQREPAPPLPWL